VTDGSEELSGAEVFVETEIELSARLDPEQEKNLRAALEKIDPRAFNSCDISAEKISLSYDPTRTNKEALLGAIGQAGGKVQRVQSESSPLLSGQSESTP
jgi:copper chaperone CopZ